jgi:hypothetical protein
MASNQLAVILSMLTLLGTGALLVVASLVAGWAAISGRRELLRKALGGALGLIAGYALLLFGAGLLSRNNLVTPDGEKYFCEIDCHLAYRVMAIRPVAQVAGATGKVWAVELRTRFDETTISAHRGREAPLSPSPRHVALRDSAGGLHESMAGTEAWLAGQPVASTPLTKELRPGDAYTTTLLFDLPAGAMPAQLLVEDIGGINALLIGGERSPWHGKRLLPLPAVPA